MGVYAYSSSLVVVCGWEHRPYSIVGVGLMSWGVSSVLLALLVFESALRGEKTVGVSTESSNQLVRRSTFSLVIIGLLACVMTTNIFLTPAMLAPTLEFYSCPVEQLNIIGATFNPTGGVAASAFLLLANTGSSDVAINHASVTGGGLYNSIGVITFPPLGTSSPCAVGGSSALVPRGTSCSLYLLFSNYTWIQGAQYQFTLKSIEGHRFIYSQVA